MDFNRYRADSRRPATRTVTCAKGRGAVPALSDGRPHCTGSTAPHWHNNPGGAVWCGQREHTQVVPTLLSVHHQPLT